MATHTLGFDEDDSAGDFETMPLLIAALGVSVNLGDTVQIRYPKTEKYPFWQTGFGRITADAFNIEVMYDDIWFAGNEWTVEFIAIRHDLGGNTITLKGIRTLGGTTPVFENFSMTNGTVVLENWRVLGHKAAAYSIYGRAAVADLVCRNVEVVGSKGNNFRQATCSRCTSIGHSVRGFHSCAVDHCVSAGKASGDFYLSSSQTYCFSGDATAGVANGCQNNLTFSDWKTLLTTNIRHPLSVAIAADSSLLGQGSTLDVNVPLDIYGQTRVVPDTPGVSIAVLMEPASGGGVFGMMGMIG